eukprot:2038442-Amphidinium_carterae.1
MSSSAAPSTPKPSSAPIPSASVPVSPLADYSPVVTPDVPQTVNSSSNDSDSNTESLSEYSGHTLLTQLQGLAASGEMSPHETSQFWGDCNDAK